MKKVLIIEDEQSIADLEINGFSVDIENSGDTRLKKAKNMDYDLIVLDLMLPKVDGFEICRQIRSEKNVPILMVSAK